MEITPKDNVTNIEAYVKNVDDKQKAEEAPEKTEKKVAKTDTVELSQTAKELQEAKKQLDTIPDVRMDKVDELKAQIEKDTYERDPEEIAKKMLKESLFNDMV